MNNEETRKIIVNSLSELINYHLKIASNEQRYPSRNADEMDDIIKDNKDLANKYKKMRNDFEDIFTDVIW